MLASYQSLSSLLFFSKFSELVESSSASCNILPETVTQQTRISFEPDRVRFINPPATAASDTTLYDQATELVLELTLATGAGSTATATSILDGEDIVMDSIAVREHEV
ncbi:hypothetical protein N657DRAFT_465128 [Parathielavia appendiculata]|uniref:Uncharacterized protein n=1 Tax=Parathielavia appendiculata TaxID=2587402 RepID=A0AAN6TP09_9PEZI|nr:hypothetical protein N657DRAFT_465128 [Parathielavia appendiculata]